MANLPINFSNAPVQVASQSASSSDAAPQDGQGFGDVLARQVADTASSVASDKKPADTAGKDAVTLLATDNSAALMPDAASSLPADLLATMLVQQNPNALTTAAAAPLQALANGQFKTSSLDSTLAAAALATSTQGKEMGTPAARTGTPTLPQLVLPAPDSAGQTAVATAQPTFADALKAMGKNEPVSSLSVESTNKPGTAELAAVQQTTVTALAPTPISTAPAMTAAASNALAVSTPVNQAGWSQEFSQKITWLATQNNQSAELHLNPPQLGPMDVVLKVSGDQATALFTSPHAAVRDAIELALPKLREMLADNGIMLGNATVSDQASRKGQDDFARAQQGTGNHSDPAVEVEAVGSQGGRVSAISRHNGLVDTFA